MREGDASARREELGGGWPTLAGATLGVAVGAAALPFYTAGVFASALEPEFGWTRSQFATVSLVTTFTIVLCAPAAGLAVDRFGVRYPAAFSLAALAAGFAGLASMDGSFGQYALIQIALFAFGVASTPISFTRAVNERFAAARGLALGLTLSGTGIAATFAPPAVAAIIAGYGWRQAYWSLAMLVVAAIPFVVMLLKPARDALERRGRTTTVTTANAAPVRHQLRDARLIRLLAAFFFLALGVSGFVLHLVPLLTDQGLALTEAAAIQARLGIAVIAGRLIVGLAVDYFFAPRVAAVSLCVTIAGIIALASAGTPAAPWAALAIGFALGAEVDLIGYLTARYFGMAAYGRLYGILYGAFILGTGISPVLIAMQVARNGSYTSALWSCAAFVAVSVVLLASAPAFPSATASNDVA